MSAKEANDVPTTELVDESKIIPSDDEDEEKLEEELDEDDNDEQPARKRIKRATASPDSGISSWKPGSTLPDYKQKGKAIETDGDPLKKPLGAYLKDFAGRLPTTIEPLIHAIVNAQANSTEIKYFCDLLKEYFDAKLKHKTDARESRFMLIYNDCTWAQEHLDEPLILAENEHSMKHSFYDEAKQIAWYVNNNCRLMGIDQRSRIEEGIYSLKQQYMILERQMEELKKSERPPETRSFDPMPPAANKPRFLRSGCWKHPTSRWTMAKRISNPGMQDDMKAPPMGAEITRPWMKPWELFEPNEVPPILFLLWEYNSEVLASGGSTIYAGADDTNLISEEARREVLYRHCNHMNRWNSPFITVTSSLKDIVNIYEPRLKAKYLTTGLIPKLHLSVIRPISRMYDRLPLLRFRDELKYYKISHPNMHEMNRGVPAFENEWLMPFAITTTHRVKTYHFEHIRQLCLYNYRKSWTVAYPRILKDKGRRYHKSRMSEDRFYESISVESWWKSHGAQDAIDWVKVDNERRRKAGFTDFIERMQVWPREIQCSKRD